MPVDAYACIDLQPQRLYREREEAVARLHGDDNADIKSLTQRELEVLALCAEGYSDAEIGAELGISVYTVGNHLRRILRKTNSANRAHAVSKAARWGYLSSDLEGADHTRNAERSPIRDRPSSALASALSIDVHVSGKDSQLSDTHRRALRLIAGIQETLWKPTRWWSLLGELADAYNSHSAILNWVDALSDGARSISHAPAWGDDWTYRYDHYYAGIHPFNHVLTQLRSDFVMSVDDIEPSSEFYQHPFYTEFARPLDLESGLGFTVRLDNWVVTAMVHRPHSAPKLTPAQRELSVLLFPHIRHVLHILWEKSAADPNLARLEDPVGAWEQFFDNGTTGVLLLDRNGHEVFGNDRAQELLRRGEWLQLRAGGLAGATEESTQAMRGAIRRAIHAAAGQALPVTDHVLIRARRPDVLPLRVSVHPLVSTTGVVPTFLRNARVVLTLSPLEEAGSSYAAKDPVPPRAAE